MSVQCKKDEKTELEKLPPLTTYGANTLGCLINGKAWPASINLEEQGGDIWFQNFYYNGRLTVDCFYDKDFLNPGISQRVYFRTNDITGQGLYKISFEDVTNDYFAVYTQYNQYRTGDVINRNGHAIINIVRFDTIKHVVSGTFQFTLFDEKGLSYVNVEQGRFDITF
jgi:hypothetical protein